MAVSSKSIPPSTNRPAPPASASPWITPARKLKAGMFAQGEILTGVDAAAVIVPGGAVYRDDRSAKSAYVFVVQDGKGAAPRGAHRPRARLPAWKSSKASSPGDRLIAEQSIEIAEGVRVEPRS